MKSFILLFFVFGTVNSSPHSNNVIELGRKIYIQRCKVCHGIKGNVNPFAAAVLGPPPRNFTSENSGKNLTEERMIRSATNGRPGTAMMPWKNILSPEEIHAVIYYIRKEIMKL
tara:strand:- start:66 stop:407 length:342 start_codon:yes stop_codon:yes gene_type:complete